MTRAHMDPSRQKTAPRKRKQCWVNNVNKGSLQDSIVKFLYKSMLNDPVKLELHISFERIFVLDDSLYNPISKVL